jgi:hypothetical protein
MGGWRWGMDRTPDRIGADFQNWRSAIEPLFRVTNRLVSRQDPEQELIHFGDRLAIRVTPGGEKVVPAPRKSTDRYRSMAHYFGALVRNLRDSYELRVGEPLAVTQLSARTGYSPSMLGSIERGESLPESGLRVQAIDDALHADGQLKTLWPMVQRLEHCGDRHRQTRRAQRSPAARHASHRRPRPCLPLTHDLADGTHGARHRPGRETCHAPRARRLPRRHQRLGPQLTLASI